MFFDSRNGSFTFDLAKQFPGIYWKEIMMNVLKNNKDGHDSIVHNDTFGWKLKWPTLGNWLQTTVVNLGIWHQDTAGPKPEPSSCLALGKLCHTGHQRNEDNGSHIPKKLLLSKLSKQVGKYWLNHF